MLIRHLFNVTIKKHKEREDVHRGVCVCVRVRVRVCVCRGIMYRYLHGCKDT